MDPLRRIVPLRAAAFHRLARLAALLAAGVLGASGGQAAIRTRHVVIVVVDGARYSETLGDSALRWFPRVGRDLAAVGAVPGSIRNLGVTSTVPGMSALATATWQPLANDGSERPHLPTLCEYLRAAVGAPDSSAWIVVGKAKLDVLGYSDHPDYGAAFGARVDAGLGDDVATMADLRARLLGRRPAFLLADLGDTDVRAHSGDWAGYVAAIAAADSLIWDLWNAIEADSLLADSTTLFVTNDHGRHDDAHGGFVNHGDGCEGCRRVCLVAAGPDVLPGCRGLESYDLRDVPRTAGYLLGIPMPLAEGRVMNELLLEPSVPVAVPTTRAPAPRLALVARPSPASATVRIALAGGAAAAGGPLEVLDLAGRRVARLAALAGGAAWDWDGRGDDGRRVPPGLYLARASVAGASLTARIVRVR
jgi:hypothetical protein